MQSSFYIRKDRLDEFKKFIRENTPSVRFKHNPLDEGDKYRINIEMTVEDGNKLNLLHNKWYQEDNKVVTIKGNRIKNFFKDNKEFFILWSATVIVSFAVSLFLIKYNVL